MARKCFVSNCTSGYRSNKESVPLFKAPKDTHLLENWRKVISRSDRLLSENDRVCAKHFRESEILTRWTVIIDSKVIHDVPIRPKLVKNAIPSIFQSYQSHSTSGAKGKNRHLHVLAVPSENLPKPTSQDDLTKMSKEQKKKKKVLNNLKDSHLKKQNFKNSSTQSCSRVQRISNNTLTAEILSTEICDTEVFNRISSAKSDTYLDSLTLKNVSKLAVSKEDSISECPASFVLNVKIKEEPWEENHTVEENVDQFELQDNRNSRERKKCESSNILPSGKRSVCSKNKKYSEPSDDHREKIFGLLVTSEMKTLRENPVLYLKAKKQILETLSNAQMKFLNYDLSS